jgi:hypothetical protein
MAAPAGPFFPIQEKGRWGYIDQQGTLVIKPKFEKAGNFSEGLARVKIDGSWGYVDETLNIRVEPRFHEAHDFSEGLAAVQINGQWGYIDRKGELVIAFSGTYERVTDFSEGMALGDMIDKLSGNKWVYFDMSHNRSMVYPFAKPFSEGLAAAYIANTWGYLDKNLETVLTIRFNSITGLWSDEVAGSFSEGLAWVHSGFGEGYERARYGYLDRTGNIVIPYRFIKADDFSEGLAAIRLEDGWGYIDMNGKIVVKPQFNEAGAFSEGLAGVKTDAQWGFIDRYGRFVIVPQFDRIEPFRNGLARVEVDDLMAYLNKEGKVVWQAKP